MGTSAVTASVGDLIYQSQFEGKRLSEVEVRSLSLPSFLASDRAELTRTVHTEQWYRTRRMCIYGGLVWAPISVRPLSPPSLSASPRTTGLTDCTFPSNRTGGTRSSSTASTCRAESRVSRCRFPLPRPPRSTRWSASLGSQQGEPARERAGSARKEQGPRGGTVERLADPHLSLPRSRPRANSHRPLVLLAFRHLPLLHVAGRVRGPTTAHARRPQRAARHLRAPRGAPAADRAEAVGRLGPGQPCVPLSLVRLAVELVELVQLTLLPIPRSDQPERHPRLRPPAFRKRGEHRLERVPGRRRRPRRHPSRRHDDRPRDVARSCRGHGVKHPPPALDTPSPSLAHRTDTVSSLLTVKRRAVGMSPLPLLSFLSHLHRQSLSFVLDALELVAQTE